MASPSARGGASKAAPALAPPRLPSKEPPEGWEGGHRPSQASLPSDASEPPTLLAMGAAEAAQALAAAVAAAAPGSPSAGSSAAAGPPHGAPRREAQLQGAPSDQVDAVIDMQPLPTSGATLPAHAAIPQAAATAGVPTAADQPPELQTPSPPASSSGGDGEEEQDGASFVSATSGRGLSPGSPAELQSAASTCSSDGGGRGSPASCPAAAPPAWQPLQPTVEPPPRPGGRDGSSSPGSVPPAAAQPAPDHLAAEPPEQHLPELPSSFDRLDSEGLPAPHSTPAGSAAPSAASSAAPSPAPSPAVTPKAGRPAGGARFPAAPPGLSSAPTSPATPAAYAMAPPRPQWRQQAATAPMPVAQQAHAPLAAAAGTAAQLGSWPGAAPPWQQRQPHPPPLLQGASVPQQRTRLAHAASADEAGPAAGSGSAGEQPPPSAGSAYIPEAAAGTPQQPTASSAESSVRVPPSWTQQRAQQQGEQQQQWQPQQGGAAASGATSSSDEPQLTEIRGEWPPPTAEPEAAEPWPPTQASSTQLQRGPSPGWGGMRSAFQAAAGQQAQPRSPAWRHLDDGSWHEPGGDVDWEAEVPSSPSAAIAIGCAAGTTAAAAQAAAARGAAAAAESEALIHDSLVEAAARSPPLSPTTTRLLALHHPSAELRRGPQRAASLGHGLSLPERQPSMLSPERQQSRLLSQPSSPLALGQVAQGLPRGGGHPGSWPGSPAPPRPTPQPSLGAWAPQEGRAGSPAQDRLPRSSLGSGWGRGGSIQQPPSHREEQQDLLPVLNASPDVAAAGPLPSPPSPFRASSAGGRFGGLGGLPVELMAGLRAGPVEKRESNRPQAADLSPREAYSEEGRSLLSPPRRPLLAPASRSYAAGGEGEGEGWDAESGPGGNRRRSNWWSSTTPLASSTLGVGLVAVPRALSLLGLVAGSVGLAAAVLLALLAHHYHIGASAELAAATGRRPAGAAEVARAALGPFWSVLTDIVLAVNCFGLMAASLVVAGDILVGGDGSGGGVLGGIDRATALTVLCTVVVLPLLCLREMAPLATAGCLSVAASVMWAAALVALTVATAGQGATHRLPALPAWRHLSGGSGHSRGWFAGTVELLAVVPILLVGPACLDAAMPPVARQLRPFTTARMRAAASTALLWGAGLAVVLALCACLLFGRSVEADVLSSITPEALASLAGKPAGPAAFLLVHLAFLVAAVAGLPLLMGPFRQAWDAVWRVLFWQPLLPGAGFLLVTLLALAGALWASLHVASLWQLLSLLGGTAGAFLILFVPGLAAAAGRRPGGGGAMQRAAGALLALAGAVLMAATALRAALFPAPA